MFFFSKFLRMLSFTTVYFHIRHSLTLSVVELAQFDVGERFDTKKPTNYTDCNDNRTDEIKFYTCKIIVNANTCTQFRKTTLQ